MIGVRLMQKTYRLEQLDSMRGLAAVSVFVYHILGVDKEWPIFLSKLMTWTPLKIFSNGNNAVMFFFVLSGFVLSIPFLKSGKVTYTPYLIKRILRIYIPYLVGIMIAIYFSQLPITNGIDELNGWSKWTTPLTLNLFLEHILFIGNTHTDAYNGAIWSLIHELRISLFFPFIVVFLVRKLHWIKVILVCLVLSSLGLLNDIFVFQVSNGHGTDYFSTIHYLSLFIIGSLLAKYKSELVKSYQELKIRARWLLLLFSFLLYSYSDIVVPVIIKIPVISSNLLVFKEYGITLGSCGFIIAALGSDKIKNFLTLKPFLFLGKVSFSLYLYHNVVLYALIYLLFGKINLVAIYFISFTVTIIVSYIFWYVIERPCIRLGKLISIKLSKPVHLERVSNLKHSS
jgi:peptidoglycan/LPS O-acetylase OafA/YrhL